MPKPLAKDKESAKTNAENLHSKTKASESSEAIKNLFKNLGSSIRGKSSASQAKDVDNSTSSSEGVGGKNKSKPRSSHSLHDILRGKRNFYFVIDALESIRGTHREVALESDQGPKLIRVKIPRGTTHGSTLKIDVEHNNKLHTIRINVDVKPHPMISIEGSDITINVPLSIPEALLGTEVSIPSPQGPSRVKIPSMVAHRKRLRLKGRGLIDKELKRPGDLYVKPYIVAPDTIDTNLEQAAKAFESYYRHNIRQDLPKKL